MELPIPAETEVSYLRIKTDSVVGEGTRSEVTIKFFDEGDNKVEEFGLKFDDKVLTYKLRECGPDKTVLPHASLPKDILWKFIYHHSTTSPHLTILYNDVILLDQDRSNCGPKEDAIRYLKFSSGGGYDQAADWYCLENDLSLGLIH